MSYATRSTNREATSATITAPRVVTATIEPEFLRLPRPGLLCPHTGLSRSYLNSLVLPTEANKHKPPVRSFCLRQRGAKTGVRLVDYASLRRHILAHPEVSGAESDTTGAADAV